MTALCAPSAAAGSLAIVAVVVRSSTAFLEPTSGPAQSASGKSSPVATPTLFHVMPWETPYSATAFAVAYRLAPKSRPVVLGAGGGKDGGGATPRGTRGLAFVTAGGTEEAADPFERMRTI